MHSEREDRDLNDRWKKAMAAVDSADDEQREHFKRIILLVAECYGKESKCKGVLVVDVGDKLAVAGINTNDMEAAGLLLVATEGMMDIETTHAPDKSMYN